MTTAELYEEYEELVMQRPTPPANLRDCVRIRFDTSKDRNHTLHIHIGNNLLIQLGIQTNDRLKILVGKKDPRIIVLLKDPNGRKLDNHASPNYSQLTKAWPASLFVPKSRGVRVVKHEFYMGGLRIYAHEGDA